MSCAVTCPVCSASVLESMINHHLDSGCPSSSAGSTARNVKDARRRTSESRSSQEKLSAGAIEVLDDSPVRQADMEMKPNAPIAPLFLGTGAEKRKRSVEETPKREKDRTSAGKASGKDPFGSSASLAG